MRVEFVKAVHEQMRADERACFVTGDLGYNALEAIQRDFPGRFVNVGVAEQNMIAVAAGMAMAGFRPWVYSIAPFATLRCLEQIRNDLCFHNLPVRVVGNGGGFTYGIMGATHHTLEELGALKMLPNMQLFFPCANNHVADAVVAMAGLAGPAYLRLGISGFANNDVPSSAHPVTLTRRYAQRHVVQRHGNAAGVTLIGVGQAAQIAVRAVSLLEDVSERVDVFGVARFPLQPTLDVDLLEALRHNPTAVFVEEHYRSGSIAESMIAELGHLGFRWKILAAQYRQGQRYGSSAYHLTQNGLTPEGVSDGVRAAFSEA